MTAAKMGEEVGVSESTVVRFATALGYEGYPQFQRALGEMVRTKLNSIQRMEVTYGRISQGEILTSVLQSDIEKIKDVYKRQILIMAVLTGFYVIFGGYMATAINDFIQGIIMLFGICAVIGAVLADNGGFQEATKALASVTGDAGWRCV